MDTSLTLKHLRCCRVIAQFFGRELTSPRLTTIKAFLIGTSTATLSVFAMQNGWIGNCCWIPGTLLSGVYGFSLVTVGIEAVAILARCIQIYAVYFSLFPPELFNPHQPCSSL